MNNIRQYRRVADFVQLVLGLILVALPWLLGVADDMTAMWTGLAAGAMIAASALTSLTSNPAEGHFWGAVAGVVVIVAAFVMGLGEYPVLKWSLAAIGLYTLVVDLLFMPRGDDGETEAHA